MSAVLYSICRSCVFFFFFFFCIYHSVNLSFHHTNSFFSRDRLDINNFARFIGYIYQLLKKRKVNHTPTIFSNRDTRVKGFIPSNVRVDIALTSLMKQSRKIISKKKRKTNKNYFEKFTCKLVPIIASDPSIKHIISTFVCLKKFSNSACVGCHGNGAADGDATVNFIVLKSQ